MQLNNSPMHLKNPVLARTHVSLAAQRVATPAALRGFTLIEVMAALVVVSFGLLGVAKLEAVAFSSTTVASKRSLAALEAASLAATMHLNRGYWSQTDPANANISVQGTTITVAGGAANLAASLAAGPVCFAAAPCAVTDMAAYDLAQWAAALQALLPNDSAAVDCGAQTPISCTITITWNENAVAANAQEAAAANPTAAFESPSYTLYVQP